MSAPENRNETGKFIKGTSGNPGGRPKAELAVRELAREHTVDAIKALVGGLRAKTESVRITAAQAILERGWGKPAQPHTGEGGEGAIELIKRIICDDRTEHPDG